jgi:ABC-2 type transport system permease protein
MKAARVMAIVRKDAAEIARRPGTLVPPGLLMLVAMLPAFLMAVAGPHWSGEAIEAGEIGDAARAAARHLPALASLAGAAQAQAFVFQQCLALLLTVPITGAMTIAAHGVIGEKQAKSLEPILATPITAVELLSAKTATPLAAAALLHIVGLVLYGAGMAVWAEPGVWRALVNVPTLLLIAGIAPLASLLALQLAVIVSSRVNDARSAQQLGAHVVLPVTALFVAQVALGYLVDTPVLVTGIGVLILLNVLLLGIGVRVFDRETILVRWK